MPSDAYYTLQSNASFGIYPDNQGGNFKVSLPSELVLDGREWVVALTEIQFPLAFTPLPPVPTGKSKGKRSLPETVKATRAKRFLPDFGRVDIRKPKEGLDPHVREQETKKKALRREEAQKNLITINAPSGPMSHLPPLNKELVECQG